LYHHFFVKTVGLWTEANVGEGTSAAEASHVLGREPKECSHFSGGEEHLGLFGVGHGG